MTPEFTDPTGGELTSNHDGATVPASATIQARPAIEPTPAVAGGPVNSEAWRRYRAICQVEELLADGSTLTEACGVVAVAPPTYCRWRNQIAGLDWRDPGQRDAMLAALSPGKSTGRPCAFEALLDLETVRQKLDLIYLATIGASSESAGSERRTAKVATTMIRFADEPECPPELALRLRRGYQPVAFVRYLRRITPEQENRLRGAKHYRLNGLVSRRDMTVRLPDGRRAEMPAGFLVELDDMSLNQPFWVEGPDGPMLSRQGLYARDVRSGRWLGVELIARPREAYRAEDILRFLRRLMSIYGKFPMLRLEQGVWKSRAIAGFRVTETGALAEELQQRPGMDQEDVQRLQDGLAGIGVDVQYATSAHRKGGIEAGFNHLQTLVATYTTGWVNIGRHAGEFEHGAKQLRRVRAGSHHPRDLAFASIDQAAGAVERAFGLLNGRVNERSHVSPDDVWSRESSTLSELRDLDLPVFLPDMREVQIRGGMVSVTAAGQQHDFRAPEMIELGAGYRVCVRWDPTEPTLGAAIYNRETSSANHRGYAVGAYICTAAYEVPGPQVTLDRDPGLSARTVQEIYGDGAKDDGRENRSAQSRLVRTAFRALPRPGQPAVRAATARDGRGAVAEATRVAPERERGVALEMPERGGRGVEVGHHIVIAGDGQLEMPERGGRGVEVSERLTASMPAPEWENEAIEAVDMSDPVGRPEPAVAEEVERI